MEFGSLGEGKSGEPIEKPLGAGEKTQKYSTHILALMLGFEPQPHCWEAGAFTKTPPNRPFSIYLNSYLALRLGGIKQKKCIIHCFKMISFVLFPQASDPSKNFNISEMNNDRLQRQRDFFVLTFCFLRIPPGSFTGSCVICIYFFTSFRVTACE